MYDDRDYNGFSYDYANGQYPSLRYGGADVTDPSNIYADGAYATSSGTSRFRTT